LHNDYIMHGCHCNIQLTRTLTSTVTDYVQLALRTPRTLRKILCTRANTVKFRLHAVTAPCKYYLIMIQWLHINCMMRWHNVLAWFSSTYGWLGYWDSKMDKICAALTIWLTKLAAKTEQILHSVVWQMVAEIEQNLRCHWIIFARMSLGSVRA